MRAIILAAVLGLAPSLAVAGPSDHASRRIGDALRAKRPDLNRPTALGRCPYALTGQAEQRRVLTFRDVPKGRGPTERVGF